jgi:dolichol-phosphate mannosyltransferase
VFKVILDLIVVKFLTRYFNKPMHFFGAVGFISTFFGIALWALAVWYKFLGNKSFVQTPLPEIGALFIIVGVQCVLFGLIAEVLMRTYYEAQDKAPYHIKEKMNL